MRKMGRKCDEETLMRTRIDDARIAAKKVVARIADGEDPAETKRIVRIERIVALEEIAEGIEYTASASTFGQLADLMMAARTDYAASTRDNYERWLCLHIKPEIGDTPAVDLTTSRIQRIVDRDVDGDHDVISYRAAIAHDEVKARQVDVAIDRATRLARIESAIDNGEMFAQVDSDFLFLVEKKHAKKQGCGVSLPPRSRQWPKK